MGKTRKRITSGDALTDWFFKKIILALNKEDVEIHVKKTLCEWRIKRIKRQGQARYVRVKVGLFGTTDGTDIYLSAAKSKHKDKNEATRTLLHEALHVAFPNFSEKDVYRLEDTLWLRLNKKQKTILRSYIPRHIIKN